MKDTFFSTLAAIGAGVASTLLGGWDKSLEILLIFIIMDYITGVAAAFKTKTLKSSVGFDGLMKKGSIFLIVILAAQLDRITGNAAGVFRTSTAFFFFANDALSVLENVGEMGVKAARFSDQRANQTPDEHEGAGDNSDRLAAARSPVSHQQGHSLAIFRRDCLVDTGQIPAVSFSPETPIMIRNGVDTVERTIYHVAGSLDGKKHAGGKTVTIVHLKLGKITKRSDGRYQAGYRDVDGKRKFITCNSSRKC
jgi:toxin secretion/phage lysis holin